MIDIAFLQRPFTSQHVTLAEMIKDNGAKLWVDYDDDLFSVPSDNPAYNIYGQEGIQKNIAKICAMADVITVSTGFLKRRLEKLNKNIIVVQNAVNDRLFKRGEYRKPDERTKEFINWRGSDTHQRDLMIHLEQFHNLGKLALEKKFYWHFIGHNPWYITDALPRENVYVVKAMDVMDYHQLIKNIEPTIQIVPLHDSIFNHSKSNIAWLEGSYSGAVTVAPNWEEWKQDDAMLLYDSPEEFGEKLGVAIDGGVDLEKCYERSWEIINEKYILSKVNHKRYEIVQMLMDWGL